MMYTSLENLNCLLLNCYVFWLAGNLNFDSTLDEFLLTSIFLLTHKIVKYIEKCTGHIFVTKTFLLCCSICSDK